MTSHHRDEFKLIGFRADQIDDVWFVYAPLIKRALDRGSNYTLAEIRKGLKAKEMQLWAWGEDAALVTTIQNRDDKRWCLLLALGGENMEEWREFLPILDAWAKENGCQELRIYGRRGWAKLGFDIEYTKLVRKL